MHFIRTQNGSPQRGCTDTPRDKERRPLKIRLVFCSGLSSPRESLRLPLYARSSASRLLSSLYPCHGTANLQRRIIGAKVAAGTYEINQEKFKSALSLFRREQFRAARDEWQRADPAQRDARIVTATHGIRNRLWGRPACVVFGSRVGWAPLCSATGAAVLDWLRACGLWSPRSCRELAHRAQWACVKSCHQLAFEHGPSTLLIGVGYLG